MIQRAPKQIPADGVVECTDTLEIPIAMAIGGVFTAAALAYSFNHLDDALENGGFIWVPLLGSTAFDLMFGAGLGYSYVHDCRKAKRLGAEQLAVVQRKDAQAKARAEAGTLWKQAFAAARADDCATVRELDARIHALDVEFHATVFSRDVAIARCLTRRDELDGSAD